jgi:hypothetical protein
MNVVCFTLTQADLTPEVIKTFLNAVRDDQKTFFTPTLYNNTPAIRAAVSNWQTSIEDIERAFAVLTTVSQSKIKMGAKAISSL